MLSAVMNYLFGFNVRDGRHQRDKQCYLLLDFGIGSIFGISASLLLVELKADVGGAPCRASKCVEAAGGCSKSSIAEPGIFD